ncbi:GPI-anchored CFEM domain protein ARB_01545 [Colletotrichum spaethianum]|uniref:GPI-anchored CFEM domain protein ARB_01545 n=1 Tax=Colletotrichum spaethianum TaxID=700344 RepID=A0AA37UPT3_9PEZI|nr:GPI-anchored CFEM domain protein ARB_01545 [Colletotrichum spaethianum]GKT51375.1 GPI-anchored CFEM domain protein ARB_01545 [Colletotrichum spaethianum]
MRRQFWAQAAAVAAFLGSVCAQLDTLPACGVVCVNNVIAKGFGCASGDNTCLCKQQDFVFGIRDCAAQSCAADETTKINDYVAGLCAISTTAPTQASAAETPASKPITEAAQATQLLTTAPTTLSASAPNAGAENLTGEAAGLSMPAKIGIGVGAGVGVLAIALALWLLIRRPKNQSRSLQISGPMPGSGRDYTGGILGMKEKNHSELEMRSRRYEDMVPRQSPRRLI